MLCSLVACSNADHRRGHLLCATTNAECEQLREWSCYWHDGLQVTFARGQELPSLGLGEGVLAALYDPMAVVACPISLVQLLTERLDASRLCCVCEHELVVDVRYGALGCVVHTELGEYEAAVVVLCTGGAGFVGSTNVSKLETEYVAAVHTRELTAPEAHSANPLRVGGGSGISPNCDYWTFLPNGTLTFGVSVPNVEYVSMDVLRARATTAIGKFFPRLEGIDIVGFEQCKIDLSTNLLPRVTSPVPRVWSIDGLSGLGLAAGFGVSKAVAEATVGRRQTFDAFASDFGTQNNSLGC